jgi:hypothetical protein
LSVAVFSLGFLVGMVLGGLSTALFGPDGGVVTYRNGQCFFVCGGFNVYGDQYVIWHDAAYNQADPPDAHVMSRAEYYALVELYEAGKLTGK